MLLGVGPGITLQFSEPAGSGIGESVVIAPLRHVRVYSDSPQMLRQLIDPGADCSQLFIAGPGLQPIMPASPASLDVSAPEG